jgi:hypothetical protein
MKPFHRPARSNFTAMWAFDCLNLEMSFYSTVIKMMSNHRWFISTLFTMWTFYNFNISADIKIGIFF